MNLSNSMRRQVAVWMAASLTAAFVLTVSIVTLFNRPTVHETPAARTIQTTSSGVWQMEQSQPVIPVYLSQEKRIEQAPIEMYVRGVVAAEMPIEFEEEALKAQAIAARTYIVRRILDGDVSRVPVKNALVTDTVAHQAYLSEDDLKRKWSGQAARENLEKLNRAVEETKDEILIYDGKPINATFFSTSNGYTENSEDYWGDYVPYLRSVKSPWDVKLSPRYSETTRIPYKDFLKKLGLYGAVSAASAVNGTRVIEWTEGHRVKEVRVGGHLFTGREVREKLDLPSTAFEWKMVGSSVFVTTKGYGHGVGMSQWGANGMAMQGKSAEEIVKYYYSGVQIARKSDYMK